MVQPQGRFFIVFYAVFCCFWFVSGRFHALQFRFFLPGLKCRYSLYLCGFPAYFPAFLGRFLYNFCVTPVSQCSCGFPALTALYPPYVSKMPRIIFVGIPPVWIYNTPWVFNGGGVR